MRLFIAITLEPDIRSALTKISHKLAELTSNAQIKWVGEENIHLTLRFLGEIPQDMLANIASAIDQTAQNHHSFKMTIRGLGAFPTLARPRVLWVGCDEPTSTLPIVYEELEGNLVAFGLSKDDHHFSPHITIGRVKFIKDTSGLVGYLNTNKDRLIGEQMVNRLTLFSSTLMATGPIYEVVREFNLMK